MKNKIIIAGIAAAAAVALVATPAFAANTPTGPFGDLNTFNATGGTSLTDGLKIDIAQGQIQVTRDGKGQLYPAGNASADPVELPNYPVTDLISEGNGVNNYFTVAFNDGAAHTISPPNGPAGHQTVDLVWNSATSSAAPTEEGRSGTIVNTLTSEETGHGIVTLEITFAYTYPDEFVNVSTKLTLPVGWTYPTRVYWNTDSTLGGADAGNQVEGTLSNGQAVRGVVSPDGAQIEAFRQVVGQNLHSWAGNYTCPWEEASSDPEMGVDGPSCNPDSVSNWVETNADAPDTISALLDVDNGFGMSVPMVETAGEHLASFDILFVSCLAGVTALQCIDGALNPAAAAVEPTLANTGINAVQGGFLAGGGALLALVGAGLVIARRRKVNN